MNSRAEAEPAKSFRTNKLDLLERLADDLAHEIRNPLHSMVINLEVLKRRVARVATESSDDLMRYIGVLASELERVNRRVDFLLQLARPERGGEVGGLGEVVEEHLELLALVCERRGIDLRFQPGPYAPYGNIPRDVARQVVLNVLLHTVDEAPSGTQLEVASEREPGATRLRVTTIGPAAEPAGDGDHRLSAARTLIEELGGRLEISPGADSGGRNIQRSFVLSIPLGRG